jgi:hypothetical protein
MFPMKAGLLSLALGLIFMDVRFARAASLTFNPSADTTLQEALPNNNFGDGFGGTSSLRAGGRAQGGRARALMQFNVSSIPAGSTINSVTFTINVAQSHGGSDSVFDLHRVTAAWGEGNKTDHGGSTASAGEANWNSRFAGSSAWATPGGDFLAAVSASQTIGGFGAYTFNSTATLVSDVQTWVNNSANNFGWLLNSESELTGGTIRRFGARGTPEVAQPTLTINFTPVPEPSTWAILGIGLAGLLWKARSRRKA